MSLKERREALIESIEGVNDRVESMQEQLRELQMLQQRQIGAMQLLDAMISEREQAEKTEAEG